MKAKTEQQLTELFERYCDRCLALAVKEYLSRADHSQLRELELKIGFLLEAPCQTDECQEECSLQRSKV